MRFSVVSYAGAIAACSQSSIAMTNHPQLATHPKEVVSPGHVVKAMIINGLGFVSAPLFSLLWIFKFSTFLSRSFACICRNREPRQLRATGV